MGDAPLSAGAVLTLAGAVGAESFPKPFPPLLALFCLACSEVVGTRGLLEECGIMNEEALEIKKDTTMAPQKTDVRVIISLISWLDMGSLIFYLPCRIE
jgi:hypothetical protein